MPLPNRTDADAAPAAGAWRVGPSRRHFAIYAVLLLLFLLAAACAGNGGASPAPATPAPPIALTPPPTITPVALPTPTRPNPTPPPTATPAPWPASPSPSPIPAGPPTAAEQRAPYVQVTVGKHHACGLPADGIAHCWGANDYGKAQVPSGMRFLQISAGLHFTCGLRYAGAIACWGNNSKGQTDAPPGSFTQLAAGREHACALDAAGTAICWGNVAPAPAADFAFTAIGSGNNYSCALTTAGNLKCWGFFSISTRAGPFTALAAGLYHLCVLRPNGHALCYGDNAESQSDTPPTAFAEIAAGWYHSCGITRADGQLECWGSGRPAQPGQRLAAPAGVFTALSSAWRNNCALRPNGQAQCWRQPNPDPSVHYSANLTPAFGGRVFDFPVELFPWPAGGLAVVDRAGAIHSYDDVLTSERRRAGNGSNGKAGAGAPHPILDLTDWVDTFGERGMVGAALDPDCDRFPFLYVYYHLKAGADNRSLGRLSRFPIVDGAADRAAELVILTLPNMYLLHVGGALRFGPDGMLYLGIGDNFRAANAPDLHSRHGKIIRIDVRGATPEQPYRIPHDNPFIATPGALPEIWAYGLRNPWRMDFDAAGNLWVADVGHWDQEEVSLATAGANLGWPTFEGNLCRQEAQTCAALRATTTPPAVTYTRHEGRAIIGGVASPRPGIAYLFGDFGSLRIWALERDAAAAAGWRRRQIAQANGPILAFGAGPAGTVYVLLHDRPILRLEW